MQCKICGNATESLMIEGKEYHVCGGCGYVALDKKFNISEDAEKKRYTLHDNTLQNKGYVKMLEGFLESGVVPFMPPGARVLDYGSGPEPVLAELMRQRGYEVSVYDKYFAPELPKGKFDAVTMTEVIEHLADPVLELKKILNVLNDGGIIAVMTQEPVIERFADWHYRKDETHIGFFCDKTFEKISKLLGLEIVKHYKDVWVLKVL